MEMRAGDDVEIGCDVTPAIFPISFSLHDSFLHSHCSACFSPLPDRPFSPRRHGNLSSSSSVFYCSPVCSSADSPLHFSSSESDLLPPSSSESSADLRAALRLLKSSSALAAGDRMFGLLTNREKLLAADDEIADRVRSGARAMAAARRRRFLAAVEEEESAICLVITNGVEVVDERGIGIGIAVYDSGFSWINHSCSPNGCYRFLPSSSELSPSSPDSALRIVPSGPTVENTAAAAAGGYGPRIVVRSIRRIKRGEEITVAYTDLLQPKAARTSELWSKYRFVCCCKRCNSSSSSTSYVDHALEEISASQDFVKDDAAGSRLADYVDEGITEFLSDDGDPKTCCRKLELLLVSGLSGLRLHPLHHLALNAYTTLSTAYRIHASNLSSDRHCPEALSKTRISAAYALFLAAAANHLLAFEPSLIACVANYWASAGECLLTLARSSTSYSSHSSMAEQYKCSKCSFVGALHLQPDSYTDFENVKLKFVDCISDYTCRSWGCLSKGCDYLERFEDPMDFSWVRQWPSSTNRDVKCGFVVAESVDEILQLGAHCLVYGGFLATICYGEQSPWINQIQRLLFFP